MSTDIITRKLITLPIFPLISLLLYSLLTFHHPSSLSLCYSLAVLSEILRKRNNLHVYSYLSAFTGSSFAAFIAGYIPAIIPTRILLNVIYKAFNGWKWKNVVTAVKP